jgi:hypothetical protein
MTDFESRVLSDLCVLKSQMESVVGGIQPGRLTALERRVERHELCLQRTKGFIAAFGLLLTLINVAVDFWRR